MAHAVGTLEEIGAAIAHQMRSPLAAIAAEAAELPAERLARIDANVQRLCRLARRVEAMSLVAKAGDPATPVDLAAVARETCLGFAMLFAAAGRDLSLRTFGRPMACVDADAAAEAISVVLENALTHGAGPTVVAVTRAGVVHVGDRGPGFAAAAADGLGLAICRRLLAQMGGHLSSTDRVGGGAAVALRFDPPRG